MRKRWGAAMRRIPGVVLAVVVVISAAGCTSTSSSAARFQTHVDILAHDDMGGRGLGSPGIERAAAYIAAEFEAVGVEPAGDSGTYFQAFPVTLQRELTDRSHLKAGTNAAGWEQGVDFMPLSFSSGEEFDGGVVFCGYGIVAPEKEHDDFAGVDVDGRVALILRGEPVSWADEEGDMTRFAMLRDKVYNAKDGGAVAVLIVNQRPEPDEPDELIAFRPDSAEEYGIPAFHITRKAADALLERAGLDSLDDLQTKLDHGDNVSAALRMVAVSGQAVFERKSALTKNVVGIIRGEGPLAEECVVIGAHYDHLGFRVPMMRKFKGGKLVKEAAEPQIHNGADDNASGVSGLIEIARMFSEGETPQRSIVFVSFTGEEAGIYGSKHYVDHPVFPLEKTVAMLNMDMIGRMKRGAREVQVFGVECGDSFAEILKSAAAHSGIKVSPIADPGGASDHAPFVYHDIPALHFFTGHHSDYHKPSDDSDKINAAGGIRVARVVYHTARELATRETRPEFHVVRSKKKRDPDAMPNYRVVMGIAPNFVENELPGMGVDGVNPDGPADLAGLKPGDRIIRMNGKDVANIYDYMASTRGNKPGDAIEVVVMRDGKELTFQVVLASAK